jgi:hypothetical protein
MSSIHAQAVAISHSFKCLFLFSLEEGIRIAYLLLSLLNVISDQSSLMPPMVVVDRLMGSRRKKESASWRTSSENCYFGHVL